MFKIENGRLSFYQWDINQRLIIEEPSITEVHFCNRTSDCSLITEVYEENGKRFANVPNVLLQEDWTIRVYAYCANYTLIEEKFIVHGRSKPADYIYTETEVKRYSDLDERLAVLEKSAASEEAINEAVERYLDENGVDVDLSGYATEQYVDDAIANIDIPTGGSQWVNWEEILKISNVSIEEAITSISYNLPRKYHEYWFHIALDTNSMEGVTNSNKQSIYFEINGISVNPYDMFTGTPGAAWWNGMVDADIPYSLLTQGYNNEHNIFAPKAGYTFGTHGKEMVFKVRFSTGYIGKIKSILVKGRYPFD